MKLGSIGRWYHGSSTKFDAFDYAHIATISGRAQEGPGFYLSSDAHDAARYAHGMGYIATVEASLRKTVPLTGHPDRQTIIKLMQSAPNLEQTLLDWGTFRDAFKSILEYTNGPHDAYQQVWVDFYHRHRADAEYLKKMVEFGYDGVIVPRDGVEHLIAFNPQCLKIVSWHGKEERGSSA